MGGSGLAAPAPAGQQSPPESPSPVGYLQPVLPTSSRTSSDAEWAAPMVPAAGTPGARPSQALGWRRLRSGRSGLGSNASGTPATGLSRGFRVGPEHGVL